MSFSKNFNKSNEFQKKTSNFFDVVETNFLWRLYYFLERSLAYISKKSSIGLDNRSLTAVEPTW